MVQLLVTNGKVPVRRAAVVALTEREAQMSTGIGGGIGIPHAQVQGLPAICMAIGLSRAGIEYEALDGEPIYVAFVILSSPENPGAHIEALAEISRLCAQPGFIDNLRAAPSPDAVMAIIKAEE
jgi:mannitol/fructose-specific phosphotransferase system IIA component (Ntr-type)